MLFYCEVRDKVEKESPKLQPHEVSSEIARRWKALPGRPISSLLRIISNIRGAKEVPEGLPESTTEPKTRQETEGTLQGPESAQERHVRVYVLLSKHHRTLLKRENASLTFGDLGKTVGAMWKAATPGEKKPFGPCRARPGAVRARIRGVQEGKVERSRRRRSIPTTSRS